MNHDEELEGREKGNSNTVLVYNSWMLYASACQLIQIHAQRRPPTWSSLVSAWTLAILH